jgi:hypothetical protein
MFNLKRKPRETLTSLRDLVLLTILAVGTSCSGDGLIGGKITSTFSGIRTAQVMGPENVIIDWNTDSRCSSYKIMKLPDLQPILTARVPPVKLRSGDGIKPSQNYTFAVACDQATGLIGLEKSLRVETWPRFDGKLLGVSDQQGVDAFEISWDYIKDPLVQFRLYAKELLSTGTPTASLGSLVTGCFIRPGTNKVAVGSTDCPVAQTNLKAGSIYEFRIMAIYPDGTDSAATQTLAGDEYFVTRAITSSFDTSNCILSGTGLGAELKHSVLTLRCSPPLSSSTNTCPLNKLSVLARQNGRIVSQGSVTMSASGSSVLEINPLPDASGSKNDRLIENLQVEFTCTYFSPAKTSYVRYELPKRTLKFQNPDRKFELAPEQAFQRNPAGGDTSIVAPSSFGSAMAVGDLNCNGKPDLAVGLPNVTYNQDPYYNQTPEHGVVKIYYDYTATENGAISSSSAPTYLSFKDLGTGAHFGASVSIGNINRDVTKRAAGHPNNFAFFGCDDLIVGAPYDKTNGIAGRAFVFFGQPGGISTTTALNSSDLRANQPTCNGDFDNLSCSPVQLVPDLTINFGVRITQSDAPEDHITYGSKSYFGYKVRYVGDHNADGFGDFVVTDPNCSWDGQKSANSAIPDGPPQRLHQVGCAYLFFGGPNGIKNDQYVGKAPGFTNTNVPRGMPTDGNLYVPFVKFYPPFPQAYMHFGTSISGGAEIDGRLPVQVQAGEDGMILASGSDFVIGAPDFRYNDHFADQGSYGSISPWFSSAFDPLTRDNPSGNNGARRKFTPPFNGAWDPSSDWKSIPRPAGSDSTKGLLGSTGIAFAYFGRHSFKSFDVKLKQGAYLFPSGNLSCASSNCFPTDYDKALGVTSALSKSFRERSNGSVKMSPFSAWTTILSDPDLNPIENWWNCGTRGAPIAPVQMDPLDSTSYYFEHFSCLAGRNNFSVIFPTLKATDPPVVRFGAALEISGTKEENAIALYNIAKTNSEFLPGDAFKLNERTQGGEITEAKLVYSPQNKIHENIKGSPLWELDVSTAGARTSSIDPISADSTGFKLTRAPVFEQLEASGINTSTGVFQISGGESIRQNDINRDGYADVVIATDSATSNPGRIFTFFGNFAGDFAYSTGMAEQLSSTPECGVSVQSPTLGATPDFLSGAVATPAPFSTYEVKNRINFNLPASSILLRARYPHTRIPLDGEFFITLNGKKNGDTSGLRDSTTGAGCKPQVITHAYGNPSSMSIVDLDRDGMGDLLIGLEGFNSSSGTSRVYSSSINTTPGFAKTGRGIGSESGFSINSPFARFGASVTGVDWKFRPNIPEAEPEFTEFYRRDVWIGAPGRDNGNGAVYNYKSSGFAQMPISTTASDGTPLLDQSNTPNDLNAELSRIIGDVNGDGKQDILVPVPRRDSQGVVYYDAIIYFGSSNGPLTNSYCKSVIGRLTTLESGGSSNLDPKLCLGSPVTQLAYLNGSPVFLPQYLTRPIGVGANWALYAFPAGDVNRDGRDDVVAFDLLGSPSQLSLFFGSPGGLDVSIPTRGAGSGLSQLVTNTAVLDVDPYWYRRLSFSLLLQNLPIRHGDFNNDGFEDLVFGSPSAASPTLILDQTQNQNKGWKCDTQYYDGLGNDEARGQCISGASLGNHGAVTIIYGGPYGYMGPTSGDYNLGVVPSCNDFYQTCNSGFSPNVRGVYGSLKKDQTGYSYDASRVPCDTCASRIVNPLFYNLKNSFLTISGMRFGESISVGDYNGDGITDLAVGTSRYWIPDFDKTEFTTYGLANWGKAAGPGNADPKYKGAVFIYYGSPKGILAPSAKEMLADLGLGLSGTAAQSTDQPVFMLTPPVWTDFSSPSGTAPKLDQHPSRDISGRSFGMNLATGDFDGSKMGNGKITADLAVASVNGQLYVYYGPFCAADNDKQNWNRVSFKHHNVARTFDQAKDEFGGSVNTLKCGVLDLRNISTTSNSSVLVAGTQKPLLPQIIEISDTIVPSHKLGMTLLSAMPNQGGNLNGDSGSGDEVTGDPSIGTSDLVVATPELTDPSIQMPGGKRTGMGYILFGEKASVAGAKFPTTPGLYVGPADFRATLRAQLDPANPDKLLFYHAPMLLRPYDPNLSSGTPTGQFFLTGAWLGDMNGDKSGDLLMPTPDLHRGADGSTPVVSGGGFTLWY